MWSGLNDDSSKVSLVNFFCENDNDSYYIRDISFVS